MKELQGCDKCASGRSAHQDRNVGEGVDCRGDDATGPTQSAGPDAGAHGGIARPRDRTTYPESKIGRICCSLPAQLHYHYEGGSGPDRPLSGPAGRAPGRVVQQPEEQGEEQRKITSQAVGGQPQGMLPGLMS